VITLVNAESRRRYTVQDLELAKDLARRAATAIENSRLFQETLESQLRLEEQAAELEAQAAELERAKSQLETANLNLQLVNENLTQKTEEAEAARAVADEANKAKSAFLATMSHELRTPLNAIGGYAQLLEEGIRGPITAEQRDDLRRIRRSQSHLTRLVNDVLNFAKLDMGRVQLKIEDVFVNDILSGIDALIRPQVRDKGLTYICTPRPEDAVTCADKERMMQVLINLITNAIKFTPAGGTISVDWDVVEDSKVAIRVKDTGRGIPADKIEQIFEPFLQLDRKLTREADGVGLGLAISRDLARAMRGDLTAESVLGEGSTFVLTLPLSTRKATPLRSMEVVPGQTK
jgi:signal transduction histidine kinase